MNNQGWIKLHRKLLEWEWWDEPTTFWVFIKCLLLANHKDNKWHGVIVKKGSFITSYEHLASKKANISVRMVRTAINKLKLTGELTSKSTNKYSIITINNWINYQLIDKQDVSQMTSKRQASDKQATTNNNDNNVKNEKNLVSNDTNINTIIPLFETINPSYKRIYSNKTERASLTRLIKQYGKEKVILMIKKLPEIIKIPYAPSITSPYELEMKMGKLKVFLQQEGMKNDKYKVGEI